MAGVSGGFGVSDDFRSGFFAIGFLLGIFLSILARLSSGLTLAFFEEQGELFAAILGAAIAGFFSLGAALFVQLDSWSLRKRERQNELRANGLSLFLRFRDAWDQTEKLRRHFSTRDERALIHLDDGLTFWKPLEFLRAPAVFSADDFGLLLEIGRADLAEELNELLEYHRVVFMIAERYSNSVNREIFSVPAERVKIEGRQQEKIANFSRSALHEISGTLEQLRQMLVENRKQSLEALEELTSALSGNGIVRIDFEVNHEISGGRFIE